MGGVQGKVLWERLTPAGEAGSGKVSWGRQGLSWVLQHWGHLGHVEIVGEVGLEAEHSRCLGYGEGDASLKEQEFSGGHLTPRELG